MVEIRRATGVDFDDIWAIMHPILAAGTTYAFDPETTYEEAFNIWIMTPTSVYVALLDGEIVGTYYIKPNQPKLGAHVCNAGYMVAETAQGQGVGRAMGQHSLVEARKLGFLGMQYNCVVSTNTGAVKLWQSLGFEIVGTLTKAFNHAELGLVDAHVMYQWLGEA